MGEVAGGVSNDCVGVAEERPEVEDPLLLHPPLSKPVVLFTNVASVAELVFDSTDKLTLRLSLKAAIDKRLGVC